MPLYEFLCQDCRKEQELLVRGDEQAECGQCGSRRLTKLLSVPVAHGSSGGPRPDDTPPGPCGSQCGCFPT